MKSTSYKTGVNAEFWCALALRLKCYRILAMRYKTPMGEVDIVATRGKMVVAVEVKARATKDSALESISPHQRARIARALQDFVMRNPRYAGYDLRFDVMMALPRRWPLHMKNAWQE